MERYEGERNRVSPSPGIERNSNSRPKDYVQPSRHPLPVPITNAVIMPRYLLSLGIVR